MMDNEGMARGWESKSVESQIESAQTRVHPSSGQHRDADEVELLRKKESLMLSRTRVLRELETSQNPRYRKLMERTLHDLDAQLSRLSGGAARAASA